METIAQLRLTIEACYYDTSTGAFYISKRTIPENVISKASLITLYADSDKNALIANRKNLI